MAEEGGETRGRGPTALPGVGARAVAFLVICVGGFCGLLIGVALVRVQCTGDCDVAQGVGALVGALVSTLGVAVIAVLVLRAMGEWQAGESRR
ncbi:MAG: hypothetical protein H0T70_09075 [Acidimicrobiia bacterium]|nr:hypothetical protein [Acidimicrobiia bacterium]